MRIALPIWNGRISPVFDAAKRVMIVELEDGLEKSREEVVLNEVFPLARAKKLAKTGAQVLICGAVSRSLALFVTGMNIQVIPWISGDAERVLSAFAGGKLFESRFRMPGCRRGRYRKRNRRGSPRCRGVYPGNGIL